MKRSLTVLAAALMASSAYAQDQAQQQEQAAAGDPVTHKASFVDAEGKSNGNAELSEVAAGGVLIKLEVTGLPAGQWVAFHVHENGECDHESGHESAGGTSTRAPTSTASLSKKARMQATCRTNMWARMAPCVPRSSTRWFR